MISVNVMRPARDPGRICILLEFSSNRFYRFRTHDRTITELLWLGRLRWLLSREISLVRILQHPTIIVRPVVSDDRNVNNLPILVRSLRNVRTRIETLSP